VRPWQPPNADVVEKAGGDVEPPSAAGGATTTFGGDDESGFAKEERERRPQCRALTFVALPKVTRGERYR
jgi:hypothetical protein